jgi:gliding motility-associated-like protein
MDSLEFSKMIAASNNIYFPNAFTPDGKGGNNVFGPYNAELIENYKLIVFNRWGEKIFQSLPNQYYWDGTDTKGEPAMEGQYIYIVTGVKNTRNMINQSGTVYLLRDK